MIRRISLALACIAFAAILPARARDGGHPFDTPPATRPELSAAIDIYSIDPTGARIPAARMRAGNVRHFLEEHWRIDRERVKIVKDGGDEAVTLELSEGSAIGSSRSDSLPMPITALLAAEDSAGAMTRASSTLTFERDRRADRYQRADVICAPQTIALSKFSGRDT
jgi:hypothetical protein